MSTQVAWGQMIYHNSLAEPLQTLQKVLGSVSGSADLDQPTAWYSNLWIAHMLLNIGWIGFILFPAGNRKKATHALK